MCIVATDELCVWVSWLDLFAHKLTLWLSWFLYTTKYKLLTYNKIPTIPPYSPPHNDVAYNNVSAWFNHYFVSQFFFQDAIFMVVIGRWSVMLKRMKGSERGDICEAMDWCSQKNFPKFILSSSAGKINE